jgi:hypothetical protein
MELKVLKAVDTVSCEQCGSDEYQNYLLLINGVQQILCQLCYDKKRDERTKERYAQRDLKQYLQPEFDPYARHHGHKREDNQHTTKHTAWHNL